MMLRWLTGLLALAIAIGSTSAQDKKAPDKTPDKTANKDKPRIPAHAVPGYTVKKVRGFHLLVSDETTGHLDDAKYELKPMDVLDKELAGVERVMPAKMVKLLQTVAIFVEWEDPESKAPDGKGVAVARYWYDGANGLGMLKGGRNPLKANNIEILNMRYLTDKWQPNQHRDQIIILHELSHAVHAHLLGYNNPAIKSAYGQAMERGLYDNVKHESGATRKAYASTNDHEYFAELTCSYLDTCAYFPFTREDLKNFDPVGFKLMEQIWGKADPRLKAKKDTTVASTKTAEKPVTAAKPKADAPKSEPVATAAGKDSETAAAQKLELIDILVVSGKTDKARDRIQDLLKQYPDTESAKKAKDLLKKLDK
jgi:hypothetical protein